MAISRAGQAMPLILFLGAVLSAAQVPVRPDNPDETLFAEVSVPPPGYAATNKPSPLKIDTHRTSKVTYADTGTPQDKFRDAVRETQLFLWATSPALPPPALQARVRALRARVKFPITWRAR